MSVRASLAAWRRLGSAALAGLRGEPLEGADRRAFHAELASSSTDRVNGFAWLLLVVHVALLARDVTLDFSSMPGNERSWARWLMGLHVAMVLGSVSTLWCYGRFEGAWRERASRSCTSRSCSFGPACCPVSTS